MTAREQIILRGMNDPTKLQRVNLAQELEGNLGEIIQFSNSVFSGRYLFDGSENGVPPFSVGKEGRLEYHNIPVDMVYTNDAGQLCYLKKVDPNEADSSKWEIADYYGKDENGDSIKQKFEDDIANKVDPPTYKEFVIPEDVSQYVDIGNGITMNGNRVEGHTAFELTFSGIRMLGFGKNEDGVPNNVYNQLVDAIEELNAQCELMQSQLYGERETTAAIRASYEKLKSDADQLVQVARNKDKELQIQLELNKQLQGRNSELESRLAAAREEQQEEEESPTPQELLEEAEARAAAILEKAQKEAAGIREAAAAREADHTAEIARLQDELSQIKESVGKTLSQLEGEISKLHGDKGAQEESRFFPPVSGQQEAGRVKVKKVRR